MAMGTLADLEDQEPLGKGDPLSIHLKVLELLSSERNGGVGMLSNQTLAFVCILTAPVSLWLNLLFECVQYVAGSMTG